MLNASIVSGRCDPGLDRMGPCTLCEGTEYRVLRLWATHPLARCTRCGLVTLAAKPPATAIREFYRCAYGEDWLRRAADDHRQELFTELLEEILRRRVRGRLLDVGCGSGLLLHLAGQYGWKTTGVEISSPACRRAKEQFGLNLFQGELADARFPEAAFDVVTFIDVLNHVADPLWQLREAYRVLKPGGLIVVRVPNFCFQRAWRRLLLTLARLTGRSEVSEFAVFHLYNFSRRTVTRLLEKAGFARVEVRNSWIVGADVYRSIGPHWTLLVSGAKRLAFAAAQALFHLSGERWVWGPSIEAYAERG